MGTIQIDGSTPKLTIGNATAEDALILFDGNAQDFHIGLDDTADDLVIGVGSALGTTTALAIDENAGSTFSGTVTVGVDDTGHDVKFFGATASSYMLWDESADDLNLVASGLGVGTVGTKDLGVGIHIKIADTGASASANADELVIEGAASGGNEGISILSATDGTGQLVFGDSGDNDAGRVYYNHSSNYMGLYTAGTERMRIFSGGNIAVGSTSDPTKFSVTTASSGASPSANADEFFIEGSGDAGMTIGSGTSSTGVIFFGDSGDNDIGQIRYNHSENSLNFMTNTSDALKIDSAGAVTKPLQPAFSAHASTMSNIPINTDTTVEFDTERFDVNADFNTGTYTFTAPVTGKYVFMFTIRLDAVDSGADYYQHYFKTSNLTYYRQLFDPGGFSADISYWQFDSVVLADMDANDTCYINVRQTAGTAQADVNGGASQSYFQGYLTC